MTVEARRRGTQATYGNHKIAEAIIRVAGRPVKKPCIREAEELLFDRQQFDDLTMCYRSRRTRWLPVSGWARSYPLTMRGISLPSDDLPHVPITAARMTEATHITEQFAPLSSEPDQWRRKRRTQLTHPHAKYG